MLGNITLESSHHTTARMPFVPSRPTFLDELILNAFLEPSNFDAPSSLKWLSIAVDR